MVQTAVILLAIIAAASADGEFSILFSPDSLEFKGAESLDSSLVSEIVLAASGHPIENQEDWNGLYIRNPFKLPKHAVVFVCEGVEDLKSDHLKAHSFPLTGQPFDLHSLPNRNIYSLQVDLENSKEAVTRISKVFGDIKPAPKKTSSSLKDREFANKIAILDALSEKVAASADLPTVLVIRMSLESVKRAHSDSSLATADAVNELTSALADLRDAARTSVGNDVLVVAVTTLEKSIRSKRQAPAPESKQTEDINLAPEYSKDYPVIFNIILWFGVVFFFSLLAICYAIGYMDPGRDSIIYRMTSTRMKKDN